MKNQKPEKPDLVDELFEALKANPEAWKDWGKKVATIKKDPKLMAKLDSKLHGEIKDLWEQTWMKRIRGMAAERT